MGWVERGVESRVTEELVDDVVEGFDEGPVEM